MTVYNKLGAMLLPKGRREKPSLSALLGRLVFFLMVAAILESTLFNWNYYATLSQQPVPLSLAEAKLHGLELQEDRRLLVTAGTNKTISLTFSDLGIRLSGVHLQLQRYSSSGNPHKNTSVAFLATDEANALPFALGSRVVLPHVPASQYHRVHLAGESTELTLAFTAWEGEHLDVSSLEINPRFPFHFSWIRLVICGLVLWAVYILIPSHGYYGIFCNFKSRRQRVILLAALLVQVSLFAFCVFANPIYQNPPWYQHSQYHRLAVALSKFNFHLDDIPSVPLTAMDNPYDTAMRWTNDIPALADTAYYNGYYFCYFGVVPVLLYHLPYYLLTGQEFPTYIGVFLTSILIAISSLSLMGTLVGRFQKKRVPLLAYLIFTFLLNSGYTFLMQIPSVYTLPSLMGIALVQMSLTLWLSATKEGSFHREKTIAGSFFMALVVGCRPQLLLCAFFALPIFWPVIAKQRLLFSKKTLRDTLLVLLPFAVVGLAQMSYNYLRFGSPFDFGANYNITLNDMTKRGFVLARIPSALYAFFLQSPATLGTFPYLRDVWQSTTYLGKVISEPLYGGLFTTNIITLGSLFVFKARRYFKERQHLWALAVMSVLFAVVIAVFDAQAAGMLERYKGEFGWLLLLTSALVVFSALEHDGEGGPWRSFLYPFLSVSFGVGMLFSLLLMFTGLVYDAPGLFYRVSYGMPLMWW